MFDYRKAVLITLGLALLLGIAWYERRAIFSATDQLQPIETGLAVCVLVLANTFSAFLFATLLQAKHPSKLAMNELAGTYLVAQSAKYFPGKVWSIALQASYLSRRIGATVLATTNIDVSLIFMAATAALGASIILSLSSYLVTAVALMVTTFAAAYITTKLQILDTVATWLISRIRRSVLASPVSSSPSQKVVAAGPFLSLLTGFCFAYLLGWSLFAGPALGNGWSDGVLWTALIALSYVIGIASLFPAGIGVRELSMVGIAPFLGLDSGHAAAIAMVSRVILIGIDLAGVGIGAILLWRGDRRVKC